MMNQHSSPNTLTHSERLRNIGAVKRLFESGKGGFVYPLRYVWYGEADELSSAEVLFTVPKRFHKRANKRNLLRRRVKEAYRLQKSIILEPQPSGSADEAVVLHSYDIALIYSTKEVHTQKTIRNAVRKILEQIAQCD